MTSPSLSKRQQKTRLAFMNAFLRLVVERGLDSVSVTDIANEANYGRWTFYQYFASKEEVAWATFTHWMTWLDEQLIQAVDGLPPRLREHASWRMLFHAFAAQRPFFLRLESIAISTWRVRAKEFLIAQFLGHLHAGRFVLMADVRPELAARLYVAAVMEMLEHWGQHPELGDADALADEFYTFMFNEPPPIP